MQFEKKIFKLSLVEPFLYFILMFVLINLAFFMFSLIEGNPRFFAYDSSYIIQIVFPVFYVVILTSINRNGVLEVTEFQDSVILTNKVDVYLKRRGYIGIDTENRITKYVRKNKWGRMLNFFFRENINVEITDNKLTIYAKRNLLDSILMKLKYEPANR